VDEDGPADCENFAELELGSIQGSDFLGKGPADLPEG